MNDKEKHINYWKTTAIDDIETVEFLLVCKKYVQTLFFTHLYIEKILKAHWVKFNIENVPPKTHNLINPHQNTNLYF
jgi:HEPN domain-containing protein